MARKMAGEISLHAAAIEAGLRRRMLTCTGAPCPARTASPRAPAPGSDTGARLAACDCVQTPLLPASTVYSQACKLKQSGLQASVHPWKRSALLKEARAALGLGGERGAGRGASVIQRRTASYASRCAWRAEVAGDNDMAL